MSYEYPYYSVSRIRSFMEERSANPLKKWGQNFITDPNTLDFIVNSIDKEVLANSDSMAEIGIGLGALTTNSRYSTKKCFYSKLILFTSRICNL